MTITSKVAPVTHPDRLFIDGDWVAPSSDATFSVVDSITEDEYFRVAEAREADMDRAISAARAAFDTGPWPRMTHAQRAATRVGGGVPPGALTCKDCATSTARTQQS